MSPYSFHRKLFATLFRLQIRDVIKAAGKKTQKAYTEYGRESSPETSEDSALIWHWNYKLRNSSMAKSGL